MIETVLRDYGQKVIQAIRNNLAETGTDATGETSESLKAEVIQSEGRTTLIVTGRPFFATVETGSKPSTKNPSPEMIKKLDKWKDVRNPKLKPWGVAKKILKEGSELWRKGGRKDIYSNVFEETKGTLREDILKENKNAYIRSIHR